MTHLPHPAPSGMTVHCAAITVSDTRSPDTDKSGQLIKQLLREAGHKVSVYAILQDEPTQIQAQLKALGKRADVDAVIFNGGTGIAPRDTTYDALEQILEKTLPGFGEIFRYLSYQEIGSRAVASRAVAGVYQGKLVFSIPGSTGAVRLAIQQLVLPELPHLVSQLKLASRGLGD